MTAPLPEVDAQLDAFDRVDALIRAHAADQALPRAWRPVVPDPHRRSSHAPSWWRTEVPRGAGCSVCGALLAPDMPGCLPCARDAVLAAAPPHEHGLIGDESLPREYRLALAARRAAVLAEERAVEAAMTAEQRAALDARMHRIRTMGAAA